MRNAPHTPGPWFYAGKHDECEVRYVGTNPVDRYEGEVATLYHSSGKEQLANAYLIAAAPDLLTVSEHAIQWLQGDKWRFDEDPTKRESWEIMIRALKNAVAKARGES